MLFLPGIYLLSNQWLIFPKNWWFTCKPPIFWKDKPLVTQQINAWEKEHLKNLIYKTNEIELLVKKNSVLAKNILADFIINNSRKANS